jgi:ABC-2 type transport system permease protein
LSLGSFGVLSLAAGIKFKYLNTFLLKKASSKAYRAGKERRGTPFLALYEKELRRYFSSVIYVVNTGFGMVLLTVFSFAVLFVSQDKIDALLGMEGSVNLLKDYLPEIVSFCVSMTCISASSISLEGKNIWLLKSLPLPAKKIFHSKIAVNLTMTVPFAVADGILLSLGFKLSYGEIASILLFPVSVSLYISIAGIYFNLLFPKLDWTTEVAVIKQSMAVVVTMFSGMAVSFLPAAVSLLLSAASGGIIYLVSAALVLTVSGLFYGLLMKTGEKKYLSRI